MDPIRKILVATDFSEVADQALDAAGVFAQKVGAQVLLVHSHVGVSDSAFGDFPAGMQPYAQGLQARLAQEKQDAAAELDSRARRLPAGVVAQTKLLAGRPAEAIMDEARQSAADLIVIGTHGRGAVGRAILGSVAHAILREAPCPVLLLGPHGKG